MTPTDFTDEGHMPEAFYDDPPAIDLVHLQMPLLYVWAHADRLIGDNPHLRWYIEAMRNEADPDGLMERCVGCDFCPPSDTDGGGVMWTDNLYGVLLSRWSLGMAANIGPKGYEEWLDKAYPVYKRLDDANAQLLPLTELADEVRSIIGPPPSYTDEELAAEARKEQERTWDHMADELPPALVVALRPLLNLVNPEPPLNRT